MTKTTRRILFYGLVLLFLLGGGTIVLYAQGWRLDVARRRLTQVGGIYVRSTPTDIRIVLDGHPAKASRRFFDNGVLLNDLFPKTYTLTIEKEGYRPWRRTISVTPAGVAEISAAVLVPEPTPTAGSVEWLWPAGNGMSVIKTGSGTVLAGGKEFPSGPISPQDGAGGLVLAVEQRSGRSFVIDARTGTSTEITAPFAHAKRLLGLPEKDPQTTAVIDRHDGALIALAGEQRIALVDTAAGTATLATPPGSRDRIRVPALANGVLVYARVSGGAPATSTLFLYRQTTRRTEAISEKIPGAPVAISWIDDERAAILRENGTLLSLDIGRRTLEPLAEGVRLWSFTDDGARFAAVGKDSMEIISPGGKGYWRFNLPDIATLSGISWYHDGEHLFLHYPDRVLFLDLDDGGLENLTLVAETPQGIYDPRTNALTFIDTHGALRAATFPQ